MHDGLVKTGSILLIQRKGAQRRLLYLIRKKKHKNTQPCPHQKPSHPAQHQAAPGFGSASILGKRFQKLSTGSCLEERTVIRSMSLGSNLRVWRVERATQELPHRKGESNSLAVVFPLVLYLWENDDGRRVLSSFGEPTPTPHLDRPESHIVSDENRIQKTAPNG